MGRSWTEAEKEYLTEHWGNTSIQKICTHLNRSKDAIMNMRTRMHLGPYLQAGDYVSFNQFRLALGIDYSHKVETWVDKRGFPLKYKQVNNSKLRVVYMKDWWKWAYENRSFLNFSKFPKNELGEEPDWVDEKRRHDQRHAKQINGTAWTEYELRRLASLVKFHKKSISEIAAELERTEGAVARKMYELGLNPGKKAKTKIWSEEEDKLLYDTLLSSNHWLEVYKVFPNRTEKSIRGKVFRVFGTEDFEKIKKQIIQKERKSA